jgi:homoserine kinase
VTGKQQATAFAPASIGNVGVGFDMLGLAMTGVGDRVTARRTAEAGVAVTEVFGLDGAPHPYLSREAERNTASIAAASLWRAAGGTGGLALTVRKGIPLQSGMGSSAASAVAAVVAANALIDGPLPPQVLMAHALEGEKFASGALHADNVAPCLLGGLVLCPPRLLPEYIQLKTPDDIVSVVLHPHMQIDTASSRRGLARGYTMEQWLAQQGFLAAFVTACERRDVAMMRRTLHDVVIEPQRAPSVSCFAAVKEAALKAEGIGCSLSGSGPSIFALCAANRAAQLVVAMEQACRTFGIGCESWISPMNAPGALIEETA